MSPHVPLPRRKLRVAMIQNSAGRDTVKNLCRLDDIIADAPECDLLTLPEVFSVRGAPVDYRAAAERLPGPVCVWAAALARRRRSWVLAGSVVERVGSRIYNTGILFDRRGRMVMRYRKIHLFAAELPGARIVCERDVFASGRRPAVFDLGGWRCGMAICYDLRFPELFRAYADAGAHLMFVPANFTRATGRSHWSVLLRARAIENQAFVVAPNQCGVNPADGIASYGHSLAVDPWGAVLAESGCKEGVIWVELDPAALRRVRRSLPALSHRRL